MMLRDVELNPPYDPLPGKAVHNKSVFDFDAVSIIT